MMLTIHTLAIAATFLPLTSSFFAIEPELRSKDEPSNSEIELERRENRYKVFTSTAPSRPSSLGIDQDGTDFSYFSTFTFGTSEEDYYLLIDTGAANIWVMSSECSTDPCLLHDTLGLEDSSSLTISDDPFSITYGTGSVSGTLASDVARFGGFNVPLTFGLAVNVSEEFSSYPMDGILGLGRPGVTSIGTSSLLDVLKDEQLISSRVFGVHLPRFSDGLNDGEISFGEPNPNYYDGELSYTPTIDDDSFWEIPVEDAGVNDRRIGFTDRAAIIDTGTSFILMPPADAQAIHALIPGSRPVGARFKVPCDTTAILQLIFSGVAYNIPPIDYVSEPLSDGSCNSHIIGRQLFLSTQWLIGAVFLKNVYTVFDMDSNRIGFGVKEVNLAHPINQTMDTPESVTSIPLIPSGEETNTLLDTDLAKVSQTSSAFDDSSDDDDGSIDDDSSPKAPTADGAANKLSAVADSSIALLVALCVAILVS